MVRKTVALFFAALISLIPLAADETELFPSQGDLNQVLEVVSDCFSTAVAATYSETSVILPSCSVSMNNETHLPSRIAFFLANPYEFQLSIKNLAGLDRNILSTILALLQGHEESDPLLAAAYLNLSSKDYQNNDYYLNGYINLSYPESTTLENLAQFILSREYNDSSILLSLSLNVVRTSGTPLSVNFGGDFEMSAKEDGTIAVTSVDSYTINDVTFEAGNYTF